MTALAQDGSLSLGKLDVGATDVAPSSLRAKLFSIRGRCGVRSFHARFAATLAALVVPVLGTLVLAIAGGDGGAEGAPFVIAMTLLSLGGIAMLASSVCVTIQRLHDLERSGWFYLVALIPVVNVLFALYYGYVPGKPEPNTYGEAHEPSNVSRIVGPVAMCLFALALVGGYGFQLFGPGRA